MFSDLLPGCCSDSAVGGLGDLIGAGEGEVPRVTRGAPAEHSHPDDDSAESAEGNAEHHALCLLSCSKTVPLYSSSTRTLFLGEAASCGYSVMAICAVGSTRTSEYVACGVLLSIQYMISHHLVLQCCLC